MTTKPSLSAFQVNETYRHRFLNKPLFSSANTAFVSTCVEIQKILTSLIIEGILPDIDDAKLSTLESKLNKSYAIAKVQLQYSQLGFEALEQDNLKYREYLSKENIQKEGEEIINNQNRLSAKISELNIKKQEILSINSIIRSFDTVTDLYYTEEELVETFGAEFSFKIKDNEATRKRTLTKTITKEDQTTEDISYIEYGFKVNLNSSVSELKEVENDLVQSIEQYNQDLLQIKTQYLENYERIQKFNELLGLNKKDDEGDIKMEDEDEDEDEDEENTEGEENIGGEEGEDLGGEEDDEDDDGEEEEEDDDDDGEEEADREEKEKEKEKEYSDDDNEKKQEQEEQNYGIEEDHKGNCEEQEEVYSNLDLDTSNERANEFNSEDPKDYGQFQETQESS
ncbi:hypothetical protein WICMUC_003224 [Wickerhamomyces mucosus]|uniref:Uncharacterized protein n=1 Tax=Wickerhamomyces mucosus TaxID=1378264 RepID=A0A9P8PN73_9ASCO|nr:hypothetical protein WICMUC_003224 [Wickerhamomyces mucosus]